MPGLFSRLKIWSPLEVVKNPDLNGEFDNIINNLGPSGMSGWSTNVAQMQVQTSPGTFGSESLATSMAGEIERIRYMLNLIIGGTNSLWYDPPALSLSQVNTLLAPGGVPVNRIASGRISSTSLQPMHLVPSGVSNQITLKGSPDFSVFINSQNYVFSSDIHLSSLATAPSSNNTFVINDANADLSAQTKGFGAFITDLAGTVSNPQGLGVFEEYDLIGTTCGSNISALQGSFAAFKYSHGGNTEYFIGFVKEATTGSVVKLSKCLRGYFFDKDDNPIKAIGLNNSESVTLMKLAWIYVKNDGTLLVSYTNPRYSAIQPATSSAGDMWYDMVDLEWKQSNGSTYSSANCEIIGLAVVDTTNVVAARSFDWYRPYKPDSTVSPEWYSITEFRCRNYENLVNVYSLQSSFEHDALRWTTTDFDSGISQTSSTTYYLYVKETAAPVISDQPPHRRPDLRGYYHPSQSWRCMGIIYSDGSSQFDQYSFAMMPEMDADHLHDKSVSIRKLEQRNKVIAGYASPIVYAPAGAICLSQTCTSQTFNNSLDVVTDGTNPLQANLICTGRPVLLGVVVNTPTEASQPVYFNSGATVFNNEGQWNYYMDGNLLIGDLLGAFFNTGAAISQFQLSIRNLSYLSFDVPPGPHTFTLKASTQSAGSDLNVADIRIFAMEI